MVPHIPSPIEELCRLLDSPVPTYTIFGSEGAIPIAPWSGCTRYTVVVFTNAVIARCSGSFTRLASRQVPLLATSVYGLLPALPRASSKPSAGSSNQLPRNIARPPIIDSGRTIRSPWAWRLSITGTVSCRSGTSSPDRSSKSASFM